MSCLGVVPVFVLSLLLLSGTKALFTCEGPDDMTEWPSDTQLEEFGDTIQGSVYLPGSEQWENATYMINTVFNSKFGAVVYPENADDVQKAILFAREHKIRPTISSSTHSFVGRNSGHYTFQINLKRMKQMDINTNDPQSDTGYSMRIGTGNNWFDVYQEVDKYNLIAVGGSAHTVSPGGWTLGGGHSPITRMKGLGVDNVLEFTMVTADGSMVTVSKNGGTITKIDGSTEVLDDGGDLWWSVLGGGGGVYGVVTQLKLKLHEPPAGGFIRLSSVFIIHTDYEDCRGVAAEALQKVFTKMGSDLPNNWGGYISTNGVTPDDPSAGTYGGTINFFMNRWGGTLEEAQAEMRFLTDFRPECQFGEADWTVYPTFLDYEKTVSDTLYYRHYMVGRLIQVDDLAEGSGLVELLASVDDVNVDIITCLCIMVGGASETFPEEGTSVTPNLRTARCALGCATGWDDPTQDQRMVYAMNEFAQDLYNYGRGVYYNEPAYFLENWKEDFWGSMDRYNRLLSTKQRWDPENLFWCHHCVGSDLVTHQSVDYCYNPYSSNHAKYNSSGRAAPVTGIWVFLALLSFLWH